MAIVRNLACIVFRPEALDVHSLTNLSKYGFLISFIRPVGPALESIPVCVQFADCTSCPLLARGMYGRSLLHTCYFQLAAL
jgi:hypothetical protein